MPSVCGMGKFLIYKHKLLEEEAKRVHGFVQYAKVAKVRGF